MESRELADRYRLEKILASSPATTVMAATEAATGRPVVVKLVHPRSAAGQDVARSRFAHWISTLRSLTHPALPAVVDAGFTPEGSAFLVLERLGGRSFAAAAPSPRRAAEHLSAVAEALGALRQRGLAHGNVAAENLWLASDPDDGEQVKLLGLGTFAFRGTAVGEAGAAADAAALGALRERFAPADAVAAEPEEASPAPGEPAAAHPAEEVLSPVDEELLVAPPEPMPPPPIVPGGPTPALAGPAGDTAAALAPPRRRVALRAPRRGVAVAAALGLALGVLFFLFFKFGGDDEPPPVRPAAAAPAARPVREPRLADLLLRGHDAHVREWAAAWIEEHAEELARAGDYGTALGALGTIASGWPERTGLAGRLARLRAHRDAEPVQRALLEETIPNFERRRKPADGLAGLARVEPTPHLAPAFAAARRRLEQQLAALDREPPAVELREGHSLEYARGTVAELSFRARDDYEVAGVRIFARPAGGSFRELPHTRSAFAYTVEIAPDLHGNGTVELYVVATDLSGHEGRLGSRERPLLLRRSEGFERMIGD